MPVQLHFNYTGKIVLKKMTPLLLVAFFNIATLSSQSLIQVSGGTNPLLGMPANSFNGNIRFVDIDADGDLDGFVGQANSAVEFFENTGSLTSPTFTNAGYTSLFATNGNSTLGFADLDGDGDFDCMVGDENGNFLYYVNNGSPTSPVFAIAATNPLNGVNEGQYSNVYFADIDADGDQDAFIGNNNGTVIYYKNTGTSTSPTFTKQIGTANPFNGVDVGNRSYVSLGDVDGDGDFDALIGTEAGTIIVFENEGTAVAPVFAEEETSSLIFTPGVGGNAAPELIDVDGDGDLDIFIGDDSGVFEYYQSTFAFDCNAFDAQTGANNPFNGISATILNSSSLAFGDFDKDGDLDAVVGTLNLGLLYYENTGSAIAPIYSYIGGTLDAASPFFGIAFGQTTMPAIVDVDGDGDLDIFVGQTDGTIQYLKNNSGLVFSEMTGASNPFNGVDVGQRSAPAFGDIDGDGDTDAFIGEQNGTVLFYHNAGTTIAPVFTQLNGSSNPLNAVSTFQNATPVLVDFDKDGDLDAFVGRFNGIIKAYENQGDANNPVMADLVGSANPFDGISLGNNPNIAFADLNADGTPDAFIGDTNGDIHAYNGGKCTALPVELAFFKAKAEGETALLEWMTASEVNNDGFNVERSSDGKNWETIRFVNGFGTTNEANFYNIVDEQPLAGANYYRLKQMDFDGQFDYSPIKVVVFRKAATSANQINIYPNPVRDFVNINFDEQPQDFTISIFNVAGQLVRTTITNERNNAIYLNDLESGLYFVQIVGEGININQKIVKY